MQKLIHSLLAFFLFTTFCGVVAAAPKCSAPPQMIDLDKEMTTMRTNAVRDIPRCLDAYAKVTETKITEFTCPSGHMFSDKMPITIETLGYRLGVAIMFDTIDESAMAYAHSLQCMRERDVMKWNQTNTIVINGDGPSIPGYAEKYLDACTLGRINQLLDGITYGVPPKKIIQTTDTFPYAGCTDLAKAKIKALENLTTLLAANGVGK